MAYSTNPHLPKARAWALHLHLVDGLPLSVAARQSGVHRTTLWRWKRKWEELNQTVESVNHNRPQRSVSFQPAYYRWNIPTLPSGPKSHPHAISDDVVIQVLAVREQLQRCAEVVWHHLSYVLGIAISLSSVKRIFRRHHIYDRTTKRRRSYQSGRLRRPAIEAPGDLVQTDTIHHVDPFSGKRMYIYTVIDLYSRMAYARVSPRILPGIAAATVLEAQATFGFNFQMVQADNGPEYRRYFEQQLQNAGIRVRHSRLQRPNDNAHIERFNRTIQTECIGSYWRRSVPLPRLQAKMDAWLDYYNTERVHLGIQLRTPKEMLQR